MWIIERPLTLWTVRRFRTFFYFLLLLFSLCYFFYTVSFQNTFVNQHEHPVCNFENLLDILMNPKSAVVTNSSSWESCTERELDLANYSALAQGWIHKVQSTCNPENVTLHCGHQSKTCGLGCQIAHRIMCLIISVTLNIPLNHDEITGWSYTDSWRSVFQPLGSKCPSGPYSYNVSWTHPYPVIKRNNPCRGCQKYRANQIAYPLKHGIPVPYIMANNIDRLQGNQFFWWVGQFVKNGFQLNPAMARKLAEAKEQLNWTSPVVGLHVRRSDKFIEAPDSVHALNEYMTQAIKYFDSHGPINSPKRIFIASDDPKVIQLAKQIYKMPEWFIMGFQLNTNKTRRETLAETVVDIFLLGEADYVVCGYSSNLCRLVQYIKFIHDKDALNGIKSLDGALNLIVLGTIVNSRIQKI